MSESMSESEAGENLQEIAGSHSRSAKIPLYRRKSILVLAALLFAAIAFGASTQTWLDVVVSQGVIKTGDIAVPGSKAATAVTALTLVAAAGALAISISGRISRVIAAVIVFLASLGIGATAITVLTDPQGAASGPVGAQIGVTGIPVEASTTPLVWIALVASVFLLLTAVAVLVWGRQWVGSKKYDYRNAPVQASVEATDEPLDDIDSWDQLSRGDDPTSSQKS